MDDLKSEFWDRMDSVRTAMLGISGEGRMVAMSPTTDDDFPGKIWFITAKGTDLARATELGAKPARMVVASDEAGLYADVDGSLARSHDREALDEAWNFVADAWFEGGKHDPDVCLLCFTPGVAEMSVTTTSAVKFFYEIAKAQVTGEKPEAGAQGVVAF
ncbi:pyridoxamine 5'-phosphate oxidase family protein [Thioclava sp. FR2]|uniref:pyridoxamine 5'-phosphate oxidase family protein n=1 Tax=Thioclava sp. FR2 TaxID=3445780 RepID=UPI003EBA3C14